MNKLVAGSVGVALFLLAGCAAQSPSLASGAEDIIGTWKTTIGATEIQFNGDSKYVVTTPAFVARGEYRFEGTRLLLKALDQCDIIVVGALGTYEVQLLENGNLKFTLIEEECPTRVGRMQEQTIAAEWELVP